MINFSPPGCAVALQLCSVRKQSVRRRRGSSHSNFQRFTSEKYMLEGRLQGTTAIKTSQQPAEDSNKSESTIY